MQLRGPERRLHSGSCASGDGRSAVSLVSRLFLPTTLSDLANHFENVVGFPRDAASAARSVTAMALIQTSLYVTIRRLRQL